MGMSRTVVSAAVLVASLALVGCTADRDPAATPSGADSSPTTVERATPAAEPDLPLPLDTVGAQTIEAEPFADFAVAVGDIVWVSGVDDGLVGYDAGSGEVRASATVGDVLAALDTRDGMVYLAESREGRSALVEVDGTDGEVTARVRLPEPVAGESSVAAGPRAAYALMVDGRIAVVDRRTSAVRTFRAPEEAGAVRYGFGSLWVPTASGHVVRVDPRTGERQARIAVGPSPRFLTVGHGSVWVMNQGDGSVSRIDPRRDRTAVTVKASAAGIQGGDIASGEHGVWLRGGYAGATLIDPATNEVTARVGTALGSGSIAEAADNLWITAHDQLAVYRVPWPPA